MVMEWERHLAGTGTDDGRPVVLCVVDRPGWTHDRKTAALSLALAGEYRLVTRYQAELSAADLGRADLLLFYYWLQIARLSRPLRRAVEGMRDRLLLGACSRYELERRWRKPGLAMLAGLPRAVFANNLELAKQLQAALGREVYYTPNGVDTGFFRPGCASVPGGPLTVGWAGSLSNQTSEHRGVPQYIVPAVAAVEGAQLCLAAREDRWRGAEEMRDYYQSLHVYVCASRSEGTPNPCLEAAACGVPIVTTAVGNMPEFIDDGVNGFFIARNVVDIAASVRRLRDDPELRARMGRAARATAVEWDWRHQSPRYATMFAEVLGSRTGVR